MSQLDSYSRRSHVRRIKNGLISAISAVALHEEGNPEFSEYDEPARKTLAELKDNNSVIHQIMPKTLNAYQDLVSKAVETYPKLEAADYIRQILSVISEH